MKFTNDFVRLAEDSVKPGGSSYVNLEKLVGDKINGLIAFPYPICI